jgi:transcription initiation factor TFIID subunit 1
MRTNKACPYYEKNNESVPSMNVAMTEEEEVAIKQEFMDESEELVKVDGTKVQLSSKLLKVS